MVNVLKRDGSLEQFDERKLKHSLVSAGARPQTVRKIVQRVRSLIYDGITTRELYDFVFEEYKRIQPEKSQRYGLKGAIARLGPEGFAFEKFIAALLERKGYETLLNQKIDGKYVTHEIDVIAKKGKQKVMKKANARW